MAVSDSGTHTSTDTSETQVTEESLEATAVFKADLTNMAAADVVTIRVYDKVLSSVAYAVWQERTYYGVQSEPVVATDPLIVDTQVKCTIQQTAGSSYKAIPWALHSI